MRLNRGWIVSAVVLALTACASHTPTVRVPSTPSSVADTPRKPDTVADARRKRNVDVSGYRRVVNGDNEYYCKITRITGSRTQKIEICKTLREWEEIQSNTRDYINGVQSAPVEYCVKNSPNVAC